MIDDIVEKLLGVAAIVSLIAMTTFLLFLVYAIIAGVILAPEGRPECLSITSTS